MDRQKLYALAREAGFKVEAGKYGGTMVVEGNGGLCEATLAKFMELVADMCSNIAFEGGYNCLCEDNILRQMHMEPAQTSLSEDVVDFLRRRVLKEHGGTGNEWDDHFNLTRTDSLMHVAAISEIEKLRNRYANKPTTERVLQAIARGFCHQDNYRKEVDVTLAQSIAEEVMIEINGTPRVCGGPGCDGNCCIKIAEPSNANVTGLAPEKGN